MRLSLLFVCFTLAVIPLQGALPLTTTPVYGYVQEVRFRPGAREGRHSITNEFLQILAEGSGKMRAYTQYQIEANLQVVPINPGANGGLDFHLRILNLQISGDKTYRDFWLDRLLYPTLADIDLGLRNPDGSLYRRITLRALSIDDSLQLIPVEAPLIKQAGNGLSLEILSVDLYYDTRALERFMRWSAALESYYAADEQLNMLGDLLNEIEGTNPETAILQEYRLCEAEASLARIAYAPFQEYLHAGMGDPLSVQQRFFPLEKKALELRKIFNYTLAHLDQLYYELALEYWQQGHEVKAREHWERALVYNPQHIPSARQLVQRDLEQGKGSEALQRLRLILVNRPPLAWEEMAYETARDVFAFYVSHARKLKDDGRFLDAVAWWESFQIICEQTHAWPCPQELSQALSQAHQGMYRSFLSVAGRAFQTGNLGFAREYVESALEYRQQALSYVPDDQEAMNLLRQIIQAYLARAAQERAMYRYAEAARNLERAREICQDYTNIACPEGLDQAIAEAKAEQEHSQIIPVTYMVSEPVAVPLAFNPQEAMDLVREKLSLGHLKAWAGELNEAREALQTVVEYALRYDLRRDTLINRRIVSLTEMIRDKDCELLKREANYQVQQLMQWYTQGNYLQAGRRYETLLQLQAQAQACACNVEEMLLLDTSVLKLLVQYQQMLDEAGEAYFSGAEKGYDIFIRKYLRATQFFVSNKLEAQGAESQSLKEFVKGSSNVSLSRTYIAFEAQQGNYQDALELLRHLQLAGIDARAVRELQELAAEKAAGVLYAQNPTAQSRILARELTGNDSWFRYYVTAFVRAWP